MIIKQYQGSVFFCLCIGKIIKASISYKLDERGKERSANYNLKHGINLFKITGKEEYSMEFETGVNVHENKWDPYL